MRWASWFVLGVTATVIAATIGKRLFFSTLVRAMSRGD